LQLATLSPLNAVLKLRLRVIELTVSIAMEAARLRCKYAELPTADAIETASDYAITDDYHLKQVREIRAKWI